MGAEKYRVRLIRPTYEYVDVEVLCTDVSLAGRYAVEALEGDEKGEFQWERLEEEPGGICQTTTTLLTARGEPVR